MLRLQQGSSSAVVTPEIGGAILGWTDNGKHVLRRASPESIMGGKVRGLAAFPLVPFCNRIAYGRFAWQGVEYQLARNFGDHPHTIHGVGWQRHWQVESTDDSAVTLSLEHDAQGEQATHWPFPFSATLTYRMTELTLRVELSMTNRHAAAAPAGLGLHPYFPLLPDATLQFQADGVWLNGEDALPSSHEAVPSQWDHSAAQPIGKTVMDNCFTGWNGRAQLRSVAIQASDIFGNLQVYTPAGQDFYCVEPASHTPNAINLADVPAGQAMHVLQPGETLAGSIWFTLSG